ncbi:TIGR03086 family metal-binding protein [Nocardioides sp. cx-173]|uniref:TIGR03086 family metal-binding protein n=1 Tax=Nocardioides sp. cx-173 TaxID=2898796 RepID=UPI001E3665F7|nr:TIGR03086 family metal-binding protein [Nocardioides sp. cx-173]MCD4523480.1 TIGR03086 family metal-binding protein [Nocardioides sp. cx-173]UGB42181.1 TIGR03086 family metal-binding protein [Nocardioides sp. cx-173]
MDILDLGPATATMRRLVLGIGDDQLALPTPCTAYTVGDLVEHVGGVALAFTGAAHRRPVPGADGGGEGDASRLEEGWRHRIVRDLDVLAEAWRSPAAYDGMTAAAGVALPGAVAARIALDEVVVHGWDLARATGQRFDAHPASVAACLEFVSGFDVPPEAGDGPFGPPVPPPSDATDLERLLALTGRDPRAR